MEVTRGHFIKLEHKVSSTLERVGDQVWRGALLGADWLLANAEAVRGKTVLEVGAGVGLTAVAAAVVGAKAVVATDLEECLPLLKNNIDRNCYLIDGEVIRVESFDLKKKKKHFGGVDLVIGCDVAYDDGLSEAVAERCLELASEEGCCQFVFFLEKRFNFSLGDLAVRAHAYDHFLECLGGKFGSRGRLEEESADGVERCFEYERSEDLMVVKLTVEK